MQMLIVLTPYFAFTSGLQTVPFIVGRVNKCTSMSLPSRNSYKEIIRQARIALVTLKIGSIELGLIHGLLVVSASVLSTVV